MCDPVSIGTAFAAIAVSQTMQPNMPKTPKLPTPEAPPQSQAAKTPDETARRAAATPTMRNAATMLTGAGGIDASSLNLGRNVLLGG